ncbi:MAG: 5'-nucleotidase C-terminal domain-containing protein [Myxococcales bacterium]|nr:5'-nucleotidase C-terminal domain-containing protein [Myxococcales bacterium]
MTQLLMSRAVFGVVVLGLVACGLTACGSDDPGAVVIGKTAVDLELRETLTRNQEAPIGNLIADAFLAAAGASADIAIVNGGGLRCPAEHDATQCASYTIPAGDFTRAELDVVLPFNNDLVIVEVTGDVLKSTLERGVSGIPGEIKGYFVHVAGMSYSADCSRTAQQLDAEAKSIVSEGDRVTSIKVGGADVDPEATYKIVLAAFIASGSDGHVQLGEQQAMTTTLKEHPVVEDYFAKNSPVSPKTEGRITLTTDCIANR